MLKFTNPSILGRGFSVLLFALLLAPIAVDAQTPVWAAANVAPIKPKHNVLFLVADDLNCDIGCYGAKEMLTPNIDKLAARGVRFEHAYCQFPLCSPSRSSFMTGRRPNVTGVMLNPSAASTPVSPHFREKIPGTITMPQLFKRHGIYSARVGKLYHYGVPADIGTSSLDDYHSWDQVINPRGRDREESVSTGRTRPMSLQSTFSTSIPRKRSRCRR